MTPWRNGNAYTDFVELMRLTKINENTFESAAPGYSPGGFTRWYGGHVYAQAALAAARTVRTGFVVHSITGWFTLQATTTKPFTYSVTTIREGGSYCQRQINVTQDPTQGVVLTAICSFKRPEPSLATCTLPSPLENKYGSLLSSRKPDEWPECPGIDSPFWWEVEKERGWVDPFPGLKTRKVDMSEWNEGKDVLDMRQLLYYKVIGEMPSVVEDANLHAAAHLYASDRNGMFPVANFLGIGNDFSAMASLNHTVIFHQEGEGLSMVDESTKDAYNCVSEERIDHISHGRSLMAWRLWREDGLHVASCFQDGLLRPSKDGQTGGAVKAFLGTTRLEDVAKKKEKL